MFNFRKSTILLSALLLATAASAQESGSSTPGEPGVIYLGGMPIDSFLKDIRGLDGEKSVLRLREEVFGRYSDDIEPLTGFSSLFERSLSSIGTDAKSDKTNPACEEARKAKAIWHIENGGSIPNSFGKIIKYAVYNVDPAARIWEGRIDLCTWIGNDEYYFEMRFHSDAWVVKKLVAHEHSGNRDAPFPGTLDMSKLDKAGKTTLLDMIDANKWMWKLHAGGDGIEYLTARMNGVDLDRATDPLFQKPNENCFDIFFKDVPKDYTLPPQLGYCMGRCDARILNTH